MSLVAFFDTDLAKLRGMTPAKLTLLQTELGMFTYGDLIQYFPFRYEDRTLVHPIASITDDMDHAQFIGRIRFKEKIGAGQRQVSGSGTKSLSALGRGRGWRGP